MLKKLGTIFIGIIIAVVTFLAWQFKSRDRSLIEDEELTAQAEALQAVKDQAQEFQNTKEIQAAYKEKKAQILKDIKAQDKEHLRAEIAKSFGRKS